MRQLVKLSVVKKRKGIQKHSRAKREVKVPTNAGQRATKQNGDAIRQAVSSHVLWTMSLPGWLHGDCGARVSPRDTLSLD